MNDQGTATTQDTGGGASVIYPRPSWQQGVNPGSGDHRLVPDTSSLNYEHLYRATIGGGNALAVEAGLSRHTCNTLRPCQAPGERTPRAAYLIVGHCD